VAGRGGRERRDLADPSRRSPRAAPSPPDSHRDARQGRPPLTRKPNTLKGAQADLDIHGLRISVSHSPRGETNSTTAPPHNGSSRHDAPTSSPRSTACRQLSPGHATPPPRPFCDHEPQETGRERPREGAKRRKRHDRLTPLRPENTAIYSEKPRGTAEGKCAWGESNPRPAA
jgi:hypothetical protein